MKRKEITLILEHVSCKPGVDMITSKTKRFAKEDFGIKIKGSNRDIAKRYNKQVKPKPTKDYESNSSKARKKAKLDKTPRAEKVAISKYKKRKKFYYFFKENFHILLKHPDKRKAKDKWIAKATQLMFYADTFPKWIASIGSIIKELDLDIVKVNRVAISTYSKRRLHLEKIMNDWYLNEKENLRSLVSSDAYYKGSQGKNSYVYFLEKGFKSQQEEEQETEVVFTVRK
jgi:hypothetical protein